MEVPYEQHQLQHVWTGEALVRMAECNRWTADRHRVQYAPGQQVWLANKDILLRFTTKKLAPKFICPFVIDSIVHPGSELF